MPAAIIAFPSSRGRPPSREIIDVARLVRKIAIEAYEHNDAWHRIEGFEKAIKSLPGGRENLHRYIEVFGLDPYDLAIHGPSGTTGGFSVEVRHFAQLSLVPPALSQNDRCSRH